MSNWSRKNVWLLWKDNSGFTDQLTAHVLHQKGQNPPMNIFLFGEKLARLKNTQESVIFFPSPTIFLYRRIHQRKMNKCFRRATNRLNSWKFVFYYLFKTTWLVDKYLKTNVHSSIFLDRKITIENWTLSDSV